MDNYNERVFNEFPIQISTSDADLTPAGNDTFLKLIAEFWLKMKLKSSIIK